MEAPHALTLAERHVFLVEVIAVHSPYGFVF